MLWVVLKPFVRWSLLSTLGGLALFGIAGLIIGPVIAAIFVTMWEVYYATFSDLLAEEGSGERAD